MRYGAMAVTTVPLKSRTRPFSQRLAIVEFNIETLPRVVTRWEWWGGVDLMYDLRYQTRPFPSWFDTRYHGKCILVHHNYIYT